MFSSKVNVTLIPMRITFSKSLVGCQFLNYHGRVNTVAKRGSMLEDMIANRDKRKNWHFNIMPTKPKVRAFEKLHKPHRRRAVLNSLFITNITDVISTGDVLPDIQKYGVEITGVQIAPCFKILNVFWQVPSISYDSSEDIGQILNAAAPKIRAELISRNVLGRVPHIFFLRDATNARVAAYEQAQQKLDSEPKTDTDTVCIVDDTFLNNMYSFKDSKVIKNEKLGIFAETKKQETEENTKEDKKEVVAVPHKPQDMMCDVFGLDHALLMDKVLAYKKRRKDPPKHTALICPELVKDADDLFSKIPGVRFQVNSSDEAESRDAILKKFHIERKMLIQKKKDENTENHQHYEDGEYNTGDDASELNTFDDDFIEDEITDNSR